MGQAAAVHRMTFAEYVDGERTSEVKHQYFQGEVFAMAGGSPEHALLAMNMGAELRSALQGGSCRVYSSDLRVRVPASGLSTYPDITVVCGPLERDPEDPNTVTNPSLLVEVLSDSTEAYDRGDKFANYRKLASLRAYVLVSQKEARIELFRRNADDTWTLSEVSGATALAIDELKCNISVSAVYAGVL